MAPRFNNKPKGTRADPTSVRRFEEEEGTGRGKSRRIRADMDDPGQQADFQAPIQMEAMGQFDIDPVFRRFVE